MWDWLNKGLFDFVAASLGVLFIFLVKDYFQSKWRKTDTLELSIKALTEETKINTEAMKRTDMQIQNLNKNISVINALEKDFSTLSRQFQFVVGVVEKLSGTPIPTEKLQL